MMEMASGFNVEWGLLCLDDLIQQQLQLIAGLRILCVHFDG